MKYYSLVVLIGVFLIISCQKRTYCPDISQSGSAHDYDGKKSLKTSKGGLVKKKQSKRLNK